MARKNENVRRSHMDLKPDNSLVRSLREARLSCALHSKQQSVLIVCERSYCVLLSCASQEASQFPQVHVRELFQSAQASHTVPNCECVYSGPSTTLAMFTLKPLLSIVMQTSIVIQG